MRSMSKSQQVNMRNFPQARNSGTHTAAQPQVPQGLFPGEGSPTFGRPYSPVEPLRSASGSESTPKLVFRILLLELSFEERIDHRQRMRRLVARHCAPREGTMEVRGPTQGGGRGVTLRTLRAVSPCLVAVGGRVWAKAGRGWAKARMGWGQGSGSVPWRSRAPF